jgi:hypothetical protein
MSRGPGYLQRYLFGLIQQKPMTFAEIRKIAQGDDIVEENLRLKLQRPTSGPGMLDPLLRHAEVLAKVAQSATLDPERRDLFPVQRR